MSFVPRPCAHCRGTQFHVIPGVQFEMWQTSSLLGIAASSKIGGGRRWSVTLVVCAQCGRTETFTTNGAELASIAKDDREGYLRKQAEAQFSVPEDGLGEAIRRVLARHT